MSRILIVGVGGAGDGAIHSLMELGVKGVRCVAVDTDAWHLNSILAHEKLLIGEELLGGLGTGGDPLLGRNAAEQDADKISEVLEPRPDLMIIVAGMGRGTGTGATPILAKIARSKDTNVLAVVRLPFKVEGERTKEIALKGISNLRRYAMVTLVSNERLREVINASMLPSFYALANHNLTIALKDIVETFQKPYKRAKLRDIMFPGELATLGVGESDDPRKAVEKAIEKRLLECSLERGKRALLIIKVGPNTTIEEFNTAVGAMRSSFRNHSVSVKAILNVDEEFGRNTRAILIVVGIKLTQ